MRFFHPSYRDRHGEKCKAQKWYIEFRDHLERVQRLPAFKDKAASRALSERIAQLLLCKDREQSPGLALAKWLETLRPSIWKRLVRMGLLDSESLATTRPLKDHVAEYRQYLVGKGGTQRHADLTANRIVAILKGIGAASWFDLKASAVHRYLTDRRTKDNLSVQSSNHYLRAFKGFCRWMVQDGRASESPVAYLKGGNIKTDRRHDRRALTRDELRRLLRATARGDTQHGMTGRERAMLYRLAVETGLRTAELRSLTRASFDLDAPQPTVSVEAAYSKRRREDELPLRSDTAAELKAFLPVGPAFCLPRKPLAEMIRVDLAVARQAWIDEAQAPGERAERERSSFLAYRDDSGCVADFHALRHTFITNLANSGIHPKMAQVLARHSSITLTMDRYSHTVIEERSDAVAALPDLSDATHGREAIAEKVDVG